jgi:hypothetical protein
MIDYYNKIKRLIAVYPPEKYMRPNIFNRVARINVPTVKRVDGVICFGLSNNNLYTALFFLISRQLKVSSKIRSDFIVTGSICGSVGVGWISVFKRSSIINWWVSNQWLRISGSFMDRIAFRNCDILHPIDDLRDWVKSREVWDILKSRVGHPQITIDGIDYIDLVVDSYLRFKPDYKFDVNHPFVRLIIWQLLRNIRKSTVYFSKVKPLAYLSPYSSYVEFGVAVRIALKIGIPVWSFGGFPRVAKRLSLNDFYHTFYDNQYLAQFKKLDKQSERLDEADKMLASRLSGAIDAATSYMNFSAYSGVNYNITEDLTGAVVIFLHDFMDNFNCYPNAVFIDYFSWLCFTIETLQSAGKLFYLKSHPNQINNQINPREILSKKYSNLKWLSIKVRNTELVQKGIVCGVTVFGTIAHELAYLGIPTICSASNPHINFGFCRIAKSVAEYKIMLETPEFVPIARNEMRRQALIFYYMRNLYADPDELAFREAFSLMYHKFNKVGVCEKDIIHVMEKFVSSNSFYKLINNILERNNKIKIY